MHSMSVSLINYRERQRACKASGRCGCGAAKDIHAHVLARRHATGPAELLGHSLPGVSITIYTPHQALQTANAATVSVSLHALHSAKPRLHAQR